MSVSDLPDSVLLLSVVPFLDTRSLLGLRCTSRRFRALVDDESVWRRKTIAEFNFPPGTTARAHTSNSWRLLYIGLARSQVFLWGCSKDGRLTFHNLYGGPQLARVDQSFHYGVPIPLRLDVKHAGSVEFLHPEQEIGLQSLGVPVALAAGGFSFAALTSTGRILGWGKLGDSDVPLWRPMLLNTRIGRDQDVGKQVKTIGFGREFLVAHLAGGDGAVLRWRKWQSAVWIRDAAGSQSRQELEKSLGKRRGEDAQFHRKIIQVEAGWDFVVTLVSVQLKRADTPAQEIDRQLWFWRPSWQHMDWGSIDSSDSLYNFNASASLGARRLPPLPALHSGGHGEAPGCQPEVVTQVAGGAGFVVVLTSAGRLFQMAVGKIHQELGVDLSQPVDCEWSRMESYDDMSHVGPILSADPEVAVRVGDISHARITHISAHFNHFAAYSVPRVRNEKQSLGLHQLALPGQDKAPADGDHKGFVLLGKAESDFDEEEVISNQPEVVPSLQGKGVIKVAFGDWHYGALTDAGHVFSWGGWQDGALGLYDSFPLEPDQNVSVEEELRIIDDDNDGSAGRHSGPFSHGRRIMPLPRRPASDHHSSRVGADSLPKEQRDELLRFLLLRTRPRRPERNVGEPTRVYFDDDLDRQTAEPLPDSKGRSFAFDIAMGGWHSGALVLDPPHHEAPSSAVDGAAETVVAQPMPPLTTTSPHFSSSSSSSSVSPSRPTQHASWSDEHLAPRNPSADEMSRAGVRVFWFSLMAGAVLVIGLLDGWTMLFDWVVKPDQSSAATGSSWLNLAYFVPVAIPLALYLAIARWTGDQFFLHA